MLTKERRLSRMVLDRRLGVFHLGLSRPSAECDRLVTPHQTLPVSIRLHRVSPTQLAVLVPISVAVPPCLLMKVAT